MSHGLCVSAHICSSRSGLQTSLHREGTDPFSSSGSWSTGLQPSDALVLVFLQKHSQTNRVPILDSDGQSSCPTEMVGLLVQPKEPSSLSVKETMFELGEEKQDEVNLTQNIQRTTGRKTKQKQLKRLHRAQVKPEPF